MGEEDDVDTLVALLEIGDGSYVLGLNSLLIEDNEMLIAYMSRTGSGCLFVILGVLNQSARNVFQSFLGILITTEIYYTYHI